MDPPYPSKICATKLHDCCKQITTLSKSLKILQDSMKKLKAEKTFTDKMNAKLLAELKKPTQQQPPSVSARNNYQLKSTAGSLSPREYLSSAGTVQNYPFSQIYDLQKQLQLKQQQWAEKLNEQERANKQHEDRLIRNWLIRERQLEAVIFNLQNNEAGLIQRLKYLDGAVFHLQQTLKQKDVELQSVARKLEIQQNRYKEIEGTKKNLDHECVAMKLQMQHMRDSLHCLEDINERLNQKLVKEERQRKQAEARSKSKDETVRYFERELQSAKTSRQKLVDQNLSLKSTTGILDQYLLVVDSRRKELDRRKKFVSAYESGLRKTQSIRSIKDDIQRLKLQTHYL